MEKEDNSNIALVKNIIYFYRNYKKRATWFLFLTIIAYVLTNIPPLIVSKAIDLLIAPNPSAIEFYKLLSLILVVGIVSTFLRLKSKNKLGRLNFKIIKEIKLEMTQKMMAQELSWHQKENTGVKLEIITSGLKGFKQITDYLRQEIIEISASSILILIVFLSLALKYFLIALIFISIYIFIELKFNQKISQKDIELRRQKEIASGKLTEFASNMTTVKSLGLEHSLAKKVDKEESKTLEMQDSISKLNNNKWICLQVIAVIFNAIFLFLIGKDILSSQLSVGSVVIYVSYLGRITSSLHAVSNNADKFIEARNQIARMMAMFPKEGKKGTQKLTSWNKIKFNKVSFKYIHTNILTDFDLIINRKEKIGIVGLSGSGKSTMFKLLLNTYKPDKGKIMFDEQNVQDVLQEDLLKNVSITPQETELFNMTIRQNITMSSDTDIDFTKYSKALKISSCDSFIGKLKQKDNTVIGEKGLKLSGGERQRVGIARAIYKNPELLVLDEATSSLDYKTEKKISEALLKEMIDKTIIIAAHRLSTLRNMDKIYVIKSGKIVQEGNYKQLSSKKGVFSNLLKAQSK